MKFNSLSVGVFAVASLLPSSNGRGGFVAAQGCPELPLPFNDPGGLKGDLPLPDCTTDPGVAMCFGALVKSGFDVLDIDNYDQWWDPEGYVKIAQTGTYAGIDSVKEYMSYGAVGAKYFTVGFHTENGRPAHRIPIVMDATVDPTTGSGTCDVAFVSDYIYDLESESLSYPGKTNGGTMTATVMGVYNYDFQFTSPESAAINIHSLRGYFPDTFWQSFAEKLDTPTFREFVCDTMKDKCNQVWKKNGYNGNQLRAKNICMDDINELPAVDAVGTVLGGWKGASLGCRQMHMSFVLDGNDSHCPHISERPIKDSNKKIKCQAETALEDDTTVDSLFNELELTLTRTIGQGIFGYDETLYAVDP